MHRVLEPEIMEDRDQSVAYAAADFSTTNQLFVDGLLRDYPDAGDQIVDIGCGPCDVMIRLARLRPSLRITAVDGSAEMIGIAEQAIAAAQLKSRVTPMKGYIPGLPLTEHSFDVVLSKDLLHHLPEPTVLWNEAKRLGRKGAVLYVMDLVRPPTADAARNIVETAAGNEPPILKEDFYNSLCAAFTLEEVRQQVQQCSLKVSVEPFGSRHMLIKGQLE